MVTVYQSAHNLNDKALWLRKFDKSLLCIVLIEILEKSKNSISICI